MCRLHWEHQLVSSKNHVAKARNINSRHGTQYFCCIGRKFLSQHFKPTSLKVSEPDGRLHINPQDACLNKNNPFNSFSEDKQHLLNIPEMIILLYLHNEICPVLLVKLLSLH